ncbi:hypothetical protein QY96_00965 [Bacillus thermotolerans]|nr:hypothetical protein QY96_00965 [Bacillus thermotolerans]
MKSKGDYLGAGAGQHTTKWQGIAGYFPSILSSFERTTFFQPYTVWRL